MTNTPNIDAQMNEDGLGLSQEFVASISDALSQDDKRSVRKLIKPLHVADVAELIHVVTKDERVALLDILKPKLEADVLVELEEDLKEEVFDQLGPKKVAAAISELEIDEAIDGGCGGRRATRNPRCDEGRPTA